MLFQYFGGKNGNGEHKIKKYFLRKNSERNNPKLHGMDTAVSRGTFISKTGNTQNIFHFQISYAISLRATKCET